jgi:hypothetical protein
MSAGHLPQSSSASRFTLVMLSALAALGCGLAAVQGDLLFVAIFGVACAVTIIEAIRRLQ